MRAARLVTFSLVFVVPLTLLSAPPSSREDAQEMNKNAIKGGYQLDPAYRATLRALMKEVMQEERRHSHEKKVQELTEKLREEGPVVAWLITPNQPDFVKLDQVYRRAYIVNHLPVVLPAIDENKREAFLNTVKSVFEHRNEDKEQRAQFPAVDKKQKSAILELLKERELERTLKLDSELKKMLSTAERKRIATRIIQHASTRALFVPVVADSLNLSQNQIEKAEGLIVKRYTRDREQLKKGKSITTNERFRLYAGEIMNLSATQAKTFFVMTGDLKPSDRLEKLPETWPAKYRALCEEMVLTLLSSSTRAEESKVDVLQGVRIP